MQASENRVIRSSLAIVWIVTGLLSLGIFPQQASFALLERIGIQGTAASVALYLGSTADITLGMLTLLKPCKTLWQTQGALVLLYTIVISIGLPEFWLHPFGPILKNIPFLTLLWLLDKHEGIPI
jgi:hypothetical protein